MTAGPGNKHLISVSQRRRRHNKVASKIPRLFGLCRVHLTGCMSDTIQFQDHLVGQHQHFLYIASGNLTLSAETPGRTALRVFQKDNKGSHVKGPNFRQCLRPNPTAYPDAYRLSRKLFYGKTLPPPFLVRRAEVVAEVRPVDPLDGVRFLLRFWHGLSLYNSAFKRLASEQSGTSAKTSGGPAG